MTTRPEPTQPPNSRSSARREQPTPRTGTPEQAADFGVVGNERLTALAGAVVLVLSVIELITIAALTNLIAMHIIVGALLAGPVAVKMASTGWRFVRYYTRSPAYRRKGPPRLILRVLAPLLVVSTVGVIVSGIALAITGPAPQILIVTHVISFLVWTVTLVIHVTVYLPKVPRLITDDWGRRRAAAPEVKGRNWRLSGNLLGLAIGALAGVLLLPTIPAWRGAENGTKFLIVAVITALIGAAVTRLNIRTGS
ncbi:hypothetical protein G3T36_02215 [Diaminobutyricibacter tongyongensis]|uniref:DUF4405 domain-containing protein n=1 Tax=Leifsonia tongyongensis TaxID=1268043 RepID=A0A6L9XTR8_9MICO|nr:hypothetical protein [Diaminobutyricibacter tongyongensis]NEN04675.1 hypothetical protein [Diaminobutyricibacter tongyongensis]